MQEISISCAGASHPARGAWIEIEVPPIEWDVFVVAPRKGCVD